MKTLRTLALGLAFAAFGSAPSGGVAKEADTPGAKLKAGETVPELRATDQFGKVQDFDSLKGQNGLVLLFFRSADW